MHEILLRDIWKLLPEAEDIEILQMPANIRIYKGRKSLIPVEYFFREVGKLNTWIQYTDSKDGIPFTGITVYLV